MASAISATFNVLMAVMAAGMVLYWPSLFVAQHVMETAWAIGGMMIAYMMYVIAADSRRSNG